MTEEFDKLAQQIGLHGQIGQQAATSAAAQYYIEEKEKSIAEAQLEVESTLERIYHKIKQDTYKDVGEGRMDWVSLKDEKKRILTEEGVERIMQPMGFYINKENLLSNFSEEQINRIMLTFRLALSANIFISLRSSNLFFRMFL